MKKKIGLFICIIATLVIFSSCTVKKKPEDTISAFFDAAKESNLSYMATKISPKDIEGKKELLQIYNVDADSYQAYFVEWSKTNAKSIVYEIKETSVNGDNATIKVHFDYVDSTPILEAVYLEYTEEAKVIESDDKKMTAAEKSELIVSIIKKQSKLFDDKVIEKEMDIKCVKIENEWYIEEVTDELLDVISSNILLFFRTV